MFHVVFFPIVSCSVDPYLLENFNTVDGDFLTAKFRAFKFPESTYVQFRGTVNVCLDKCQGVGWFFPLLKAYSIRIVALTFYSQLRYYLFINAMLQIECSNGQIGFGRKRRAIDVSNTDKNKIFEVTMSALIKVDFEEDAVVDKGKWSAVRFPPVLLAFNRNSMLDSVVRIIHQKRKEQDKG